MPDALRILTVIPDFGQRGTQRVGENFSVEFRRLGHEVGVLPLFSADGPRRTSFERAGIEIVAPAQDLDAQVAGVASFAPDVVHIHRAGLPFPVEGELLRKIRPLAKAVVETNIFARADETARGLIDVHFHLTRAGLYRWNRLASPGLRREQPGIYLPNAVDLDSFVRADEGAIAAYRRDRLAAASGDFVFGRIGKASHHLPDVVRELLTRVPNARLASIEGMEELYAALPEAVRRRIVTVPKSDSGDDLNLFYSSIDALLHWSGNGESFGMVLAESIACGTPVAMPLQLHLDVGGIEVVGHDEGGIIAGHSGRLADAAIHLMERRREFDGRVALAQERHRREYGVRVVAARALDAMRLAIDARRDGQPLGQAFAGDPRFETEVSSTWFADLVGRRLGPASVVERAIHLLTHHRRFHTLPGHIRAARGWFGA